MAADGAYLRWDFAGGPDVGILVAELDAAGFEAFQETPDGLSAFARSDAPLALTGHELLALGLRLGFRATGPVRMAERNWNAEWEATVKPVYAGSFVVHPPWEQPDPGYMPIRIEPRMSFGTGHHESTRLMLASLPHVVGTGDRVLDAGTGTGVLAIAAVQLGAAHVTAFDTDPWSVRNAIDNIASNGMTGAVDVVAGSVDAVLPDPVQVVLGNINRSVLVDMLPALTSRLAPGGRILLSGFLEGDRAVMESALADRGCRDAVVEREGEWCAVRAVRL